MGFRDFTIYVPRPCRLYTPKGYNHVNSLVSENSTYIVAFLLFILIFTDIVLSVLRIADIHW